MNETRLDSSVSFRSTEGGMQTPAPPIDKSSVLNASIQSHPVSASPPPDKQATTDKADAAQKTRLVAPKSTLSSLKAKVVHFGSRIVFAVWERRAHKVGVETLGTARNVARQDVLASESDFHASKELLNQFAKLSDSDRGKLNVTWNPDAVPEKMILNGICAGIRLDIAQRFLHSTEEPKEAIEQIIEENLQGAPAEAAANQAIYELLSPDFTQPQMLEEMKERMIEMAQSDKFPGGAIDKDTLNKFVGMDLDLDSIKNLFDHYNTQGDRMAMRALELAFSLKEMDMTIDEASQPTPPPAAGNSRWEELKESVKRLFSSPRKQALSEKICSKISHPLYKEIISAEFRTLADLTSYEAIGKMRGLKFESVTEQMGHHSFYGNDKDYLANLPNLEPGFYMVDLNTSTTGHAISYVKYEDGSGRILDPNGIQVKCKTPQEAAEKLAAVISLHTKPKTQHPLQDKDKPYHQIVMKKISQNT